MMPGRRVGDGTSERQCGTGCNEGGKQNRETHFALQTGADPLNRIGRTGLLPQRRGDVQQPERVSMG